MENSPDLAEVIRQVDALRQLVDQRMGALADRQDDLNLGHLSQRRALGDLITAVDARLAETTAVIDAKLDRVVDRLEETVAKIEAAAAGITTTSAQTDGVLVQVLALASAVATVATSLDTARAEIREVRNQTSELTTEVRARN